MFGAYRKRCGPVRVSGGENGSASVYNVRFPGFARRLLSGFLRKIPELKRPKVVLAILAGIILPLVALICSIAYISEENK